MDENEIKIHSKYSYCVLFLNRYDYDGWFVDTNDQEPDNKTGDKKNIGVYHAYNLKVTKKKKLDHLTPLEEVKEEVKERAGVKILTPNKLLTTLPILLAQTKAGNTSHKQKTKSDKYYISCIGIKTLLKYFATL